MVAMSLFWLALPAVVYGLLAMFLLPSNRPPRARSRAVRPPANRAALGANRDQAVDPFDALNLQIRLGVLATQLRSIENDPRLWARARRFQATQHAYDELLAQACRLAGVELAEDDADARLLVGRHRSEPERFREEVELVSRGWTW